MFDIQQELKKLPAKPGVYLMHNSKDEIIYVGKAIKLCNRVRQYFQDSRNLSVKIQHMVKNVAYFEYIITDSELEALVLENNLIKEHHPKYNTKLKDDKGYPYIKVTVNEEFPRIMLARKMKADGGKYFGPYTSAGAVNDTIELLRKIFKILIILCHCNNVTVLKRIRIDLLTVHDPLNTLEQISVFHCLFKFQFIRCFLHFLLKHFCNLFIISI